MWEGQGRSEPPSCSPAAHWPVIQALLWTRKATVVLSLSIGPPAGLLGAVLASLLGPKTLFWEYTPLFPPG